MSHEIARSGTLNSSFDENIPNTQDSNNNVSGISDGDSEPISSDDEESSNATDDPINIAQATSRQELSGPYGSLPQPLHASSIEAPDENAGLPYTTGEYDVLTDAEIQFINHPFLDLGIDMDNAGAGLEVSEELPMQGGNGMPTDGELESLHNHHTNPDASGSTGTRANANIPTNANNTPIPFNTSTNGVDADADSTSFADNSMLSSRSLYNFPMEISDHGLINELALNEPCPQNDLGNLVTPPPSNQRDNSVLGLRENFCTDFFQLPPSCQDSPTQSTEFPCYTDMGGLLEAAESLTPEVENNFEWGRFTNQAILEYLRCFQPPGRVTSALVNYFSMKLSWQNGILILNSDWRLIDTPQYTLLDLKHLNFALAPCYLGECWSLLYVDCLTGNITHYFFQESGNTSHSENCSDCLKFATRLTRLWESKYLSALPWKVCSSVRWSTVSDSDCGTIMLWLLKLLASGRSTSTSPPENYIFTLASEIMEDVRKDYQKNALYEAIGGRNYTGVKRKFYTPTLCDNESLESTPSPNSIWETFPGAFGSTVSLQAEIDKISRLPSGNPGGCLGQQRASRLMQLLLNIATPNVFLGIKSNIAHLRSRSNPQSPFSSDIQGLYNAGIWHTRHKEASTIALRLISWSVHNIICTMRREDSTRRRGVKEAIALLTDTIKRNLPNISPDEIEQKLGNWYSLGRGWSKLVDTVHNASVLFFLPRDMNIFPGEKLIGCNEYRDLKLNELGVLRKLFPIIRPCYRQDTPPAEICNLFIYHQITEKRFQIELWDKDDVSSWELDSPNFLNALKLVQ